MNSASDTRKLKGLEHFFAAARYSAGGAQRAWRESAFRQEIAAGLALAVIYRLIGVPLEIYIGAAILFLVLLAIEALNTAIEEVVDRVSPEISATGKHAKDLGSFAVLCAICANGLLLAYALIAHFLPILS